MNEPVSDSTPKENTWQRSLSLVRSSLRILQRDKQLMKIPLTAAATCLGILLVYGSAVFFTSTFSQSGSGSSISGPLVDSRILAYGVWFGVIALVTFTAQFFTAALVSAILMRLGGSEPQLDLAYRNARERLGSIVSFSAFSMSIGLVLSMLEERLPLGGQIASWLAGAAWSIASMFAIPVIMTEKQPISPLQATRKSVEIIKKTWGENLVARLGVGIVGTLAIAGLVMMSIGMWIAAAALSSQAGADGIPTITFLVLGSINFILFLGVVFVLSLLGAIIKTAVFHYGLTGEAPVEFEERVLKSSFTPKQARRLFGS